ncbi:hypothetical protein [Herbaspirillum seropedicae]|uniref:hypothetical protein n=1 Tax=Herbaspirillum seropedicae TaxID=964 RepID=UPI003FCEC391
MKKSRYLVLINFAAKLSRQHLSAVSAVTNSTVRSALGDCEAIFVSEMAVAFVGLSGEEPGHLFKLMAARLREGDHLSVIALGNELMTSHPGLMGWYVRQKKNLDEASRR